MQHIEIETVRACRLRAHHLDKKMPMEAIQDAAGACGLQNSPPGAWETALFNRLEGCTLQKLHDALYQEKSLLQAWSYRGVPVVFPTEQSGVFLSALRAQEGEQPWIYTRGITAALDFMQMTAEELLPLVKKAAAYLDTHTVERKETLDRTLADIVQKSLPSEKQVRWHAPSMYGAPDKQTVGEAAVSFLLRPCSFSSLVVFGERQGDSPAFTSYQNWTGNKPSLQPQGKKELVRKFLHCHGPSTLRFFIDWLGCAPKQGARLWNGIADEIEPVEVEGRIRYMLSADVKNLLSAQESEERLLLLGAHDPYLDTQDKAAVLENEAYRGEVWQTVANPGTILKKGRIIGIWRARSSKNRLDMSLTLWEKIQSPQRRTLEQLAEEYAAFRLSALKSCTIVNV